MKLSETDLERLNAYHDGELDKSQVQAIARRLAAEPALREALEGIREVSQALGALKPRPAASAQTPRRAAGRPWMRMAAALAGVAVLASGILWGVLTGQPDSPAGWHRQFVAQEYPQHSGSAAATPVAKWVSSKPDLSAANLRLVDVAGDSGGAVYLHYAGVNNCRLTFGAHAAAPAMPAAAGGLLVHGWSTDGIFYSMIADGMDRGKFAAIIALLEEQTRRNDSGSETVMALREATGSAVPCA